MRKTIIKLIWGAAMAVLTAASGLKAVSAENKVNSERSLQGLLLVASSTQLFFGPQTCRQGYVWREAFPGDYVCVTPATRDQAASDNSQAQARRRPGGGPYGSDTCLDGYVWREARPSDHVCVTPKTREDTATDNRLAPYRLASSSGTGQGDSNASNRTCTIFQHRDFEGAHWTLRNGDDMKMVNAPTGYGYTDNIHRFIFEPSWNDNVSSFKVGPTCTLTLWVDVGGDSAGGSGHFFRSNRSYAYVGSDWNDKASEALCQCAGLPNW